MTSRYLEVIPVSLRELHEQFWDILERRESFSWHLRLSNKLRCCSSSSNIFQENSSLASLLRTLTHVPEGAAITGVLDC